MTQRTLYICRHCELTLDTLKELLSHSIQHLEQTKVDDKYVCPICETSFTVWIDTVVHIESHGCEICYLCHKPGFDSCSKLSIHLQRHRDINAFPCPLCQNTFLDMSSYLLHCNGHIYRGEGVRCTICSEKFFTIAGLEYHLIESLKI